MPVTLHPPAHLAAPRPAPVAVHAILMQEVDAPGDQEPVRWLLLATFPVATADQAATCLRWYTYRWLCRVCKPQSATMGRSLTPRPRDLWGGAV